MKSCLELPGLSKCRLLFTDVDFTRGLTEYFLLCFSLSRLNPLTAARGEFVTVLITSGVRFFSYGFLTGFLK